MVSWCLSFSFLSKGLVLPILSYRRQYGRYPRDAFNYPGHKEGTGNGMWISMFLDQRYIPMNPTVSNMDLSGGVISRNINDAMFFLCLGPIPSVH